jgi:arsenate reductase (glutaredoxin)
LSGYQPGTGQARVGQRRGERLLCARHRGEASGVLLRLTEGTMATTIYHNPACGTSRNTLAIIRATGEEPTVVEYLSDPPTRERLVQLMQDAGLTPRALLREKGTPYAELGLGDPTPTDEQLIDAMMAHPILINRPLVETARGARLCRPSEVVLEILEHPLTEDFVKEDGEVVSAARTGA